jgi:multicomponent Na+:H+ antiporter subunit D
MIGEMSPGLILVLGAVLVPFLKGQARAAWMLALPIIGLMQLLSLPMGDLGQTTLAGVPLTTMRVDGLSWLFGFVFLFAAFIGILYNLYHDDPLQHAAGLVYAGSAIGAVFAGDLVTFFLYWEGTAIASVFLIWASGTERAYRAGMRYLIIQIGSGVILLAGILIHHHATGSLAFTKFGLDAPGAMLILLAIGIKCAFPLLGSWLPDAYPQATPGGTVLLSAFTTKLAIYALARAFPGTDILIPIGLVMAVVPLIYAMMENDLRRTLAYTLNNQLGFMVVAVGIGTEMAISGAAAQAFVHVVYKSLLFMAIGAVLYRTGTAEASALGGLRATMPLTAALCIIGGLSIASPLLGGFVAKSLILSAAMKGGYFWVWLILLGASAGAFVATAIKIPYAAFFAADSGKRPEEAPKPMLAAMSLAALASLIVGLWPSLLYGALPFPMTYDAYTLEHVVTQLQLMAFATLAMVVMVALGLYPFERPGQLLGADWLYRGLGYRLLRWIETAANAAWTSIVGGVTSASGATVAWARSLHGPDGLFGRTWPTGTMALWTTVMLGAYLILAFV